MPDKYKRWSKNQFISSHNGTPDWRIFSNFSNDVKVWNYVVVNIGQQKIFFFLGTTSQVEMGFDNPSKSRNAFKQKSFYIFLGKF